MLPTTAIPAPNKRSRKLKTNRKPSAGFRKWLSDRGVVLDGTEKFIILTQGLWAVIDAEDYPYLSQHNWCAHRRGNGFYAVRGIRRDDGTTVLQHLHRVILGLTDPSVFADHINGVGLDNRRSNLRGATHRENTCNRGVRANNKLGLKGVSRQQKKFRAEIKYDGKPFYLGLFRTPVAAALAYNAKAIELNGCFAGLNDLDRLTKAGHTVTSAQLRELQAQLTRLSQLREEAQTEFPKAA